MATKFKFEIESDGLTVEQSQAFSNFVKSLGAETAAIKNVTEALQPLQYETQQQGAESPETPKKKRASRAKAEEVQAEEVQAEEVQAEEVQAEEVQAEEVQAEEAHAEEAHAEEKLNIFAKKLAEKAAETKTSAFSIQDVRDRVKEKQVKWRTSIKAELERLGSSSVSLLDPEHFEEFCNFMDNLA